VFHEPVCSTASAIDGPGATVTRGGNWVASNGFLEASQRWRLFPDHTGDRVLRARDPEIGFRCARAAPPADGLR
jgi:hypothetical protein